MGTIGLPAGATRLAASAGAFLIATVSMPLPAEAGLFDLIFPSTPRPSRERYERYDRVDPPSTRRLRGYESWDDGDTANPEAPPRRTQGKRQDPANVRDTRRMSPADEPLQLIVSLATQRVTVYRNGAAVAQSPVSSGVQDHPTPTGIFSIVAKNRWHRSNIYSDAPMPYMQRITWSGVALHEGHLPGRPASHGCVRLPQVFAINLWDITRLGARVIIARDSVTPMPVSSDRLFNQITPVKPETPVAAVKPVEVAARASASDATPSGAQQALPDAPTPATPPAAEPVSAVPSSPPDDIKAARRKGAVQAFVSRKDARLYVRQGFKPLFDVPVTIADVSQPWGTHVFTVMEIKDAKAQWNVVSMPSGHLPAQAAKPRKGEKAPKLSAREQERRAKLAADLAAAPDATQALTRFELPAGAIARISELLGRGSSLIVSDNALAKNEVGDGTDFVVFTP